MSYLVGRWQDSLNEGVNFPNLEDARTHARWLAEHSHATASAPILVYRVVEAARYYNRPAMLVEVLK